MIFEQNFWDVGDNILWFQRRKRIAKETFHDP